MEHSFIFESSSSAITPSNAQSYHSSPKPFTTHLICIAGFFCTETAKTIKSKYSSTFKRVLVFSNILSTFYFHTSHFVEQVLYNCSRDAKDFLVPNLDSQSNSGKYSIYHILCHPVKAHLICNNPDNYNPY